MKLGTRHSLCYSRLTCELIPRSRQGQAQFLVRCRTLCRLRPFRVSWYMSIYGIGTRLKLVSCLGYSDGTSSDSPALSTRRQMDDVHKYIPRLCFLYGHG